MAVVWSSEQILALAPDAGSVKNGKALATATKWQNLGGTDRVLWGECQGSGKNPYQAQIDLAEPAFKCSCPSRKFPCKHGLGLFLLHTSHPNLFTQDALPDWVEDWIDKRSQTAQKKEEKQKAPVDEVAQAKRQQKRSDQVSAGLADLDLWLQDIISSGLADTQAQSYGFWDGMAARMVDTQAPGLARRVRQLAGIANSGQADWASKLLVALSQIHLIIQGYQRLDSLSPELAAEVRSQIGWTTTQDELLGSLQRGEVTSNQDEWLVMGKSLTEDATSNLKTQRVWLWGQNSQQIALILNFAVRNQPIDVSWLPGSLVTAELIFFPSSYPLRAILVPFAKRLPAQRGSANDRDRQDARQPATIPGDESIIVPFAKRLPAQRGFANELAIDRYRQALIHNPWLETFPLLIQAVTPGYDDGNWSVRDRDDNFLPVELAELRGWQLLALSGGKPIALMGEWDGHKLRPLGIWHDGGYWQANIGEVW